MGNDNAGENARNRQEAFKSALVGKHLPVLTLDNKWYKLLNKTGSVPLKETEDALNQLLKRQGKLNTESKEIRNLKKKLMKEIVPMVNEADQQGENSKLNKQIAWDLGIAETTVKAHISAILRKLGVQSRTQAVLIAQQVSFSSILHPGGATQ